MEWNIQDQTIEYQVDYWRVRAQIAEERLVKDQKRKAPENLVALEKEVRRLQEKERMYIAEIKGLREYSTSLSEQITRLSGDTVIARLEKEILFWKDRWKHTTQRLAVLLEHQGNVELLEDRLKMVRSKPLSEI